WLGLLNPVLVSTTLRLAASNVSCLTDAREAEWKAGPRGSENGSVPSEDGSKGEVLGSGASRLIVSTSAASLVPRNPSNPNSEWWLRTPVRPGSWQGSKGFSSSPDSTSPGKFSPKLARTPPRILGSRITFLLAAWRSSLSTLHDKPRRSWHH